jgi:hypothetical protein
VIVTADIVSAEIGVGKAEVCRCEQAERILGCGKVPARAVG